MPESNNEIVKVERLLTLFKPERYAYLIICLLCCLTLIVLGAVLMSEGKTHFALGMFGSSGVIGVCMGRMMKMWNDVIKVLFKENVETNEPK